MTPAQHPPTTAAATFGLPPTTPVLIAKLRNMDPDLLNSIRGGKKVEG